MELSQLEAYCEAFYDGKTPEEQANAHRMLLPMVGDPECVPQLQAILAQSRSQYALIFASSALAKLVTNHWCRVSETQMEDTKRFLLNYLYNSASDLVQTPGPLLTNLLKLLCRIIKLGWLERLANQTVVEQVQQFLQGTTAHWIVGLAIYSVLTEDMMPVTGPQFPRMRRTAISFRETAITDIFSTGVSTLTQVKSGGIQFGNINEERLLVKYLLQLLHNCLGFDFAGIALADMNEDAVAVHLPNTWVTFLEKNVVINLRDLYLQCWRTHNNECARLCLQCLVQLAGVRRSIFRNEASKRQHLDQCLEVTKSIIFSGVGLRDDDCFHELCRLLSRINLSGQMWNVLECVDTMSWLRLVFQFTLTALADWSRLPHSKHYLVGVWCNLVPTLIGIGNREAYSANEKEVLQFMQRVTAAYIDSRMLIAEAGAEGDTENDPLTDDVMRAEQLDIIRTLCKCTYGPTCSHVIELFKQTREAAARADNGPAALTAANRFSWLVYIAGTLLGATSVARFKRITRLLPIFSPTAEPGVVDLEAHGPLIAELSQLVLELMAETDRLPSVPATLELAYLSFLSYLRELYVSEQQNDLPPVKVQQPFWTDPPSPSQLNNSNSPMSIISRLANGNPKEELLNVMVTKVVRNLEIRANDEQIVKQTLAFLQQAVTGVSVVQADRRSPLFMIGGRVLFESSEIGRAHV